MYLIETFLNGPASVNCVRMTLLATGVNKVSTIS